MHAGSLESTREAFEWHEAKPSTSLACQVLSQLPRCIRNSIDAQLKHGPFLLQHCHFKRKLIKYRILLNHSERFDRLNAITQFNRRTGERLLIFRCTLAPYKSARKISSCVLSKISSRDICKCFSQFGINLCSKDSESSMHIVFKIVSGLTL